MPPATKEKLTEIMRDVLYGMDCSSEENIKLFEEYKLNFIGMFEGESTKAYDDGVGAKHPYKYAEKIFAARRKPVGKITIGHGFNMDRPEARGEWEKILGNEVSFEDAYMGKVEISNQQMKKLLKYSVDLRENELKKIYGEAWKKLTWNEIVGISSAYYNSPKLVGANTRFCLNMIKYKQTWDLRYLQEAVIELGERSGKNPELTSRRRSEASMLDSTKVPSYVKPNENTVLNQPLKIILNETRVPIGLERIVHAVQNADFFIWRNKIR